jgi:RimJ/RimL family protein N-acetyltransferase
MLRTGYKTEAEQAAFYRDVVCNPEADHRYYAIEATRLPEVVFYGDHEYFEMPARVCFVGFGGLTYLGRVPGEAEISLIVNPRWRRTGIGRMAVDALLAEAFGPLGLTSVVGECYETGNLPFWTKRIVERPAALRWTWRKP